MLRDELGDARNVSLRFEGFMSLGGIFAMTKQFDDVRIKTMPVAPFYRTGQTTTVGFRAYLDYDYVSSQGALKHTRIVIQAFKWDLTLTADGIEIDNGRPGEGGYESNYLSLDFLPSSYSSSPAKPARIMIAAKLSPTNNTKGVFSISTPVLGYTPAVDVSSSYVNSEQMVLEFIDMRPKVVPRPASVSLPPDLRVFFNEGSANVDEIPKGIADKRRPRDQVDAWMTTMPGLYPDLWTILKSGKSRVLEIKGFASNTSTPAANDRVSSQRAENVKRLIVSRIGTDGAILAQGWGIDRPTPAPHQAAPGPIPDERYVLVTVAKDEAVKAIRQFVQ